MISDPLAIFVTLAAVVYAALRLEERFAACRSLQQIVGGRCPGGTGVNIAFALILLSVDVRSILVALSGKQRCRVGHRQHFPYRSGSLLAAITVAFHGIVIFGLGRLLKMEISTLVVASQSNVGGPATSLALASARGYANCVLPGVAVGLFGYAVGSYTGFAVAMLLRGWLAG